MKRAHVRPRQGLLLALCLASLACALCLVEIEWRESEPQPQSALERDGAKPQPRASERAVRARRALALLLQLREQVAHESAARAPEHTPHPITAEHRKLYQDVDLLAAADAAIRAARYDEARSLLAEHQRELPSMSRVEAEGLWLLADCSEVPSAENVARVRAFYEHNTASTVRRRLRRGCLERAQP